MNILGLTGSFGSGKSTVAAFFRELGLTVIDADRIARDVVEPGREAHRQIVEAFGEGVLLPDGGLDRVKVARMVFRDAALRETLERIIHPQVRRAEHEQIEKARQAGEALIVLDVPLLFESGLNTECDWTCVVTVDPQKRLERLKKNGLDETQVEQRLRAQMSQEEKVQKADFVIDNSGTLEQTRQQAVGLIDTLTSLAGATTPPKE